MYDIVALGECLIDFTPHGCSDSGIPLFQQNPGGAPANVLAEAAKLGCSTAFIGKVGDDSFGNFLERILMDAGIDCSSMIKDPSFPTSLAFVSLDENGDRSFSFYRHGSADVMLSKEDVDARLLGDTRIFHFGSVSMTDEPSRSATIDAARIADEAGALISYDPNYRPLLWNSQEEAISVINSVLPYCDIVKVSYEELQLMTGLDDLDAGAEAISAKGPECVVVTLGPDGAFIRTGKYSASYRTYDVKTIDTTGAGDSFYGAFLYKILQLCCRSGRALSTLSADEIDSAMMFANAAGSLATMKHGAIPSLPGIDEINRCISSCSLL